MGELYDLGVRVFTDDGDCVADAHGDARRVRVPGALPGAVLAQHAEDPALVRGGHMHEGAWSARLGIPGRPADAESSIVARRGVTVVLPQQLQPICVISRLDHSVVRLG